MALPLELTAPTFNHTLKFRCTPFRVDRRSELLFRRLVATVRGPFLSVESKMNNAGSVSGGRNPNRSRRRGNRGGRGGARRGGGRRPQPRESLMPEQPEPMMPPLNETPPVVERPATLPFGHEFYVVPPRPTLAPSATEAQEAAPAGAAALSPIDLSSTPESADTPVAPATEAHLEPPAEAPVQANEPPSMPPDVEVFQPTPPAPAVPTSESSPEAAAAGSQTAEAGAPGASRQGFHREDPRRAHLRQYLREHQAPSGGPLPMAAESPAPAGYRPAQQQQYRQPQPGQRPFQGQPQNQPPRVPQRPASPQSVEQAVRHCERIIDSLKRSLDMMEEVLDSLEIARIRGEAEEREIQDLTRALQRMQRMEDRAEFSRPRSAPAAPAPGSPEPSGDSSAETADAPEDVQDPSSGEGDGPEETTGQPS